MKASLNRYSIIVVVSLAAILALVHTSEATCANKAVYDSCSNTGNSQLSACYAKPNDFICQCAAMKGICQKNDRDITDQGNSYEVCFIVGASTEIKQTYYVDKICLISIDAAPAPTQPEKAPSSTPTNQANPPAPNGPPPSSPNNPAQTSTSDKKSFANPNNDGRQIFFAIILSIAALIMAF
ncbi:9733_t:CDS:2 [Racocetra fulgida]|uniref:9733_t:CDS:1 n=1 Tax=Racocetra fulgida TaxID=60492 RepID=A0A9N9CWM2_9GLOM|nr:9733_t:CDS:2 [Racocetra fulgida]